MDRITVTIFTILFAPVLVYVLTEIQRRRRAAESAIIREAYPDLFQAKKTYIVNMTETATIMGNAHVGNVTASDKVEKIHHIARKNPESKKPPLRSSGKPGERAPASGQYIPVNKNRDAPLSSGSSQTWTTVNQPMGKDKNPPKGKDTPPTPKDKGEYPPRDNDPRH